jgi:hypothetical protein
MIYPEVYGQIVRFGTALDADGHIQATIVPIGFGRILNGTPLDLDSLF